MSNTIWKIIFVGIANEWLNFFSHFQNILRKKKFISIEFFRKFFECFINKVSKIFFRNYSNNFQTLPVYFRIS